VENIFEDQNAQNPEMAQFSKQDNLATDNTDKRRIGGSGTLFRFVSFVVNQKNGERFRSPKGLQVF